MYIISEHLSLNLLQFLSCANKLENNCIQKLQLLFSFLLSEGKQFVLDIDIEVLKLYF